MRTQNFTSGCRRRGSVLLPSLIAVVAMAGIAMAAFTISMANMGEVNSSSTRLRALYLAESGISEALNTLAAEEVANIAFSTEVGTQAIPIELVTGSFWVDIVDNGDDTFTLTSTGRAGPTRRSVEVVVNRLGDGVFDHAIFAGNSSGDPNYTLGLGGTGAQADQIDGNIFSNGDIDVTGDAAINGDVAASGTISGTAGSENENRPLPNIAAMNYETNNDVDVAANFTAGGVPQANALGGTADELPEDDPAHIFRKNPDDRAAEINGTTKDDFFLEDPYMPVTDFTAWNGSSGHTITLSGAPTKPGINGNELVYYIDGNLWVHNKPFGRLRFLTQDGGVNVTFVVKGNVYFSDDVLAQDPNTDAFAFIAIKDKAEPDSGNIYLGDPRYGTLDRMYGFLYAENNFYDLNLDAAGSKEIELFGNMTAGNHVDIDRDHVAADGTVNHSKLTVHFDDRISTGAVNMFGLPDPIEGVGGFQVALWREVSR